MTPTTGSVRLERSLRLSKYGRPARLQQHWEPFSTDLHLHPSGSGFHTALSRRARGVDRLGAAPQRPQVRLALSRWTSADGSKWVTSGPPIAAGRSYVFGGQLGYVMTAPSNQSASVKLDECFSVRSGNGFLSDAGRCVAEGAAAAARRRLCVPFPAAGNDRDLQLLVAGL